MPTAAGTTSICVLSRTSKPLWRVQTRTQFNSKIISANLTPKSLRLLPMTQTILPLDFCKWSTGSQGRRLPSAVHAVEYGKFKLPGTAPLRNLPEKKLGQSYISAIRNEHLLFCTSDINHNNLGFDEFRAG